MKVIKSFKKVLQFRGLFSEIVKFILGPNPLLYNNEGVIVTVYINKYYCQTKYTFIYYFKVTEIIFIKVITIIYFPMEEIFINGFTKALPVVLFSKFIQLLNLSMIF